VNLAGAEDGFVMLFSEEVGRILRAAGDYRDIAFDQTSQLPKIAGRTMEIQEPQLIADVSEHTGCDDLLPETCAVMTFPLHFHERAVGVIHLETRRTGNFTPQNFDFMKLLASRIATAIDNARLYQVSQHQLTELQQLYTQVSNLEQLKTDMIRIASHDLRNPVGIINGYLELMRLDITDRLDESEREYLDGIDEAVKRMQSIVTDILSLERIQQVAHKPFSDRVDIAELAERVVQGHALEAEKKSLQLDLDLRPGQQPFSVRGDRAQLFEALSNLLTNAIKYTPEGGQVGVVVEQQGGRVALIVRDTGYGIPEGQQERLFQPFYRVQTRETLAIDGLGLGLHLVKNIVERHKGRMLFESTYGEGSLFGFELPLIPEI
jgi:signal transduction histidine kinase